MIPPFGAQHARNPAFVMLSVSMTDTAVAAADIVSNIDSKIRERSGTDERALIGTVMAACSSMLFCIFLVLASPCKT